MDVAVQPVTYGLELVDALTGGPLVGWSAAVDTTSQVVPYLVNASRWVFEGLPPAIPITFAISAHFYVPQTVTTGIALPNPTKTGPGYLATITMMPRTGYPFPPTLTRVIGLVRLGASVDVNTPTVTNATVTLQPIHSAPPAPPVNDNQVIVATTDDGQFTFWFLPQYLEDPPIANQLTGIIKDESGHQGSFAVNLTPNGVTYAPTTFLT
jgi:hypothetical protein